jgi:hypothetical protein
MTSTNPKQINCIYAGGTQLGNQVEAVLTASKKDILLLDITKTSFGDAQWAEIIDRLETPMDILIDTNVIENNKGNADYDINDIIKVLKHNPKALKGALIIKDERLEHVTTYSDVLKFFGVDSAGLEKTLHTDAPITKSQTNNESFIK